MRLAALLMLCLATALALAAAGCGRERPGDAGPATTQSEEEATAPFEEEALSGRVTADGSSTLAPFVTLAAERFRKVEPGVRITVGVAGTGGGFERFCRGETDLSNASRPVKDEEQQLCRKNGIDFVELHVANDAIAVVVNPQNTWAECLTVAELSKIWQPGSDVDNWSEVRAGFPDVELALYGPGTDSGTFDYFTDVVVGEEGASRSDYSASEDDNVIVNGVAGDRGALGYFGLSYLLENEGKVKGIGVDGGDGCVKPSVRTAQDGSYEPLSRPLFVYVNRKSLDEKPQVEAFLRFMLDEQVEIATDALFVPLTDEQLAESRAALEGV